MRSLEEPLKRSYFISPENRFLQQNRYKKKLVPKFYPTKSKPFLFKDTIKQTSTKPIYTQDDTFSFHRTADAVCLKWKTFHGRPHRQSTLAPRREHACLRSTDRSPQHEIRERFSDTVSMFSN